jgi:hypothetical protein
MYGSPAIVVTIGKLLTVHAANRGQQHLDGGDEAVPAFPQATEDDILALVVRQDRANR